MHRHLSFYSKWLIPNARRMRREMTIAEGRIWSRLRDNQLGLKFRRQVPFGRYILDFYCAKARICVELDGSQHYTDEGKRKDQKRDDALRKERIVVLRFSDRDALANTDEVVQMILERVATFLRTASHPSPERGRGSKKHPLLNRRGS